MLVVQTKINTFYFKIQVIFVVRDHTFMISTKKKGGVLTFVTFLRILSFSNNRFIVHFCGRDLRLGWSHKIAFFMDVINVWPINVWPITFTASHQVNKGEQIIYYTESDIWQVRTQNYKSFMKTNILPKTQYVLLIFPSKILKDNQIIIWVSIPGSYTYRLQSSQKKCFRNFWKMPLSN